MRQGEGDCCEEKLYGLITGTVLDSALGGENITALVIHSFGHGIFRGYSIYQGGTHGIIAPHVLRYIFDNVDGRRDLLAEGFGVGSVGDPVETAAAVVDAVETVREALGLPAQLRVMSTPESDLLEIASDVVDDVMTVNTPEGLEPTESDLDPVLRDAW